MRLRMVLLSTAALGLMSLGAQAAPVYGAASAAPAVQSGGLVEKATWRRNCWRQYGRVVCRRDAYYNGYDSHYGYNPYYGSGLGLYFGGGGYRGYGGHHGYHGGGHGFHGGGRHR